MPTESAAKATVPGVGDQRLVRLRLLDGFQLVIDGRSVEVPGSTQRLLAFLALHRAPLHRSYTAGLLWLDVPDDRAAANLRAALWRIRQLVGHLVSAGNGTVGLAPGVVVDMHEASDVARRWIRGPGSDDQVGPAIAALEHDLLPDWYDDWVVAERERFRQLRLHALEAISGHSLAAGRLGDALVAALAALVSDPLRESAHRALIRVHLAEGNTGEAVRQVRLCERLLQDELGVDPSARLVELLPWSEVTR